MSYEVITQERFSKLRWQRTPAMHYAAQDELCGLVAVEIPSAALALPIAFILRENAYIPVALQGLGTGQNFYVHPDGRWLTTYIPAAYRTHPFHMARTPAGEEVLCVDTTSGLITEAEGEPFFTESGEPGLELLQVVDFHQQIAANRSATQQACAVLQAHGLIQPWPLVLQAAEGQRNLQGLYRIDEAALNALPAEALKAVQAAGGLTIAYCQLLSMQHVQTLEKLAQLHEKSALSTAQALPVASGVELDLEFLNSSGTIGFGG